MKLRATISLEQGCYYSVTVYVALKCCKLFRDVLFLDDVPSLNFSKGFPQQKQDQTLLKCREGPRAGQLESESVAAATPNQPMMSASSWPDPAPGVFMQAEAPQSEQRRTDEIAQRFAGFFFRVLATEPEKVDLHPHAVRAGCCRT